MKHKINSVGGLTAFLLSFGSLTCGANAAIIILTFEVNDAGHVLDGATITATVPDADVWTIAGSRIFTGSMANLSIVGATGSGAVWNGFYTPTASDPFGYGDTTPGAGGSLFGPSEYNPVSGTTNSPNWSDGSGNTFAMDFLIAEGTEPNSAGSQVVQENFGAVGNPIIFTSTGGTNPSFSEPNGTATLVVIPEPTSLLFLGFTGIVVLISRRRKS
ncbi:MAG: PEP-CTERM sorting domain-containing protein [Verrucomicrobiota bacterium]